MRPFLSIDVYNGQSFYCFVPRMQCKYLNERDEVVGTVNLLAIFYGFQSERSNVTDQLVPVRLSNCRSTLYVATHRMLFPSLKQIPHLSHARSITQFWVHDIFGFRQLRANPSIPIIFDRFSFKSLKIAPGKLANIKARTPVRTFLIFL